MRTLLTVCMCGALSACSLFSNDDGGPGLLPLNELIAAPDTLALGGQKLVLRTFIWRDFQPVSPPDGKSLIALFWIYSEDSTALPAGLDADAAWLVDGNEIWGAYLSEETPPPGEQKPYQLYKVVRDGPKWGPGISIRAVVRLRYEDGESFLLGAADQFIGRTD